MGVGQGRFSLESKKWGFHWGCEIFLDSLSRIKSDKTECTWASVNAAASIPTLRL